MLNRYYCQTAIAAIALVIGCGGCTSETALPTYPTVVEVVSPSGSPIQGAQVTFRFVDDFKITAYGKADVNGDCQMTTHERGDGAVLGLHQVVVGAPTGEGDLDEVKVEKISPRFANYSTSNLEFTVTEDEAANRFKIVVTRN